VVIVFLIFLVECSEKGTQLVGLTGTIQSPNYPGSYPPNIKCVWNITVPVGYFIRVTIVTLRVLTLDDRYCTGAGVYAQNGPLSTSPMLLKACGWWNRFSFFSSTRHLLLTFRSDSARSTGFLAQYKAITGDQGKPNLNQTTGSFSPATMS
jgi:cubilin